MLLRLMFGFLLPGISNPGFHRTASCPFEIFPFQSFLPNPRSIADYSVSGKREIPMSFFVFLFSLPLAWQLAVGHVTVYH